MGLPDAAANGCIGAGLAGFAMSAAAPATPAAGWAAAAIVGPAVAVGTLVWQGVR